MNRTFIMTQIFDQNWNRLKLTDIDLMQLEKYIMRNPDSGDIIQGTGGLRKLRWSLPNTGKSGGIRVLYIDFVYQETIILVNCYGKNEKDNISENEKAIYKEFIKNIGREMI